MNNIGVNGDVVLDLLRTVPPSLAKPVYNLCKHWVNQSTLPKEKLLSTPIVLPPINEQRRIVAKLEDLLGKVEACQKRLTKIPWILKRFRQSVLTAACSGRLTAQWRNSEKPFGGKDTPLLRHLVANRGEFKSDTLVLRDLPERWFMSRFGAVVKQIRGGSTAVPRNEPTQFPILRSSSVRPGCVDLDDVKFLAESDSRNDLNYLADGDLLFTRLSGSLEYVANCAKVRGIGRRRIQYPDRLFCAKLVEGMDATYCELVFAAPFLRGAITELAKSSAGHQRVSISDITAQSIPIPPSEEQAEIVRQVGGLFKLVNQIEARHRKAQLQVAKLTQSILCKAFRGELVPTEAELAQPEGHERESRLPAPRTQLR
jgi:type I restriction enzyme S subunit